MRFVLLCLETKEILLNIIVPLMAAFIGGFMALLGVKITLRQEAKRRENEHKNQFKPLIMHSAKKYISYDDLLTTVNLSTIHNLNGRSITDNFIAEINTNDYFLLKNSCLRNTQYADFCFMGIKINEKEYMYGKDEDVFIPKTSYIDIKSDNYLLYAEGGVKKLEFIVADIDYNKYYIKCVFESKKEKLKLGTNKNIEKDITTIKITTISRAMEK